MNYTVSIPDEREPCITRAREEYNASLSPEVDDGTGSGNTIPNPDLLQDNAAYMSFVMDNATKSYCVQYFPNLPGTSA